MEEHNIVYFRNLWQSNVKHLESLCKIWEDSCKNNTIPEEVVDEIRTTVGLAKLLMNQKLSQFKGLMDDSEFKTGEKEITCIDLEGFWDMVYFEVEKIQKKFGNLDKCRENDWKIVEENVQIIKKKKVPTQKMPIKVESSKSHILAARQRLAEAKKKMLAQREQKDQIFVEIIQPSKDITSQSSIKKTNVEKENADLAVTSNVTSLRKSKSKGKQSPAVHKISSYKSSESSNHLITPKSEIKQQNASVVQNKENFIPAIEENKKSNEKTPVLSEMKRKSKEYGKLQCVTRSAKKALSAQQNAMQKS